MAVFYRLVIPAFGETRGSRMANHRSTRIFYGWRVLVAAFLNLFFAVGIIFYGFPVIFPALVEFLGLSRPSDTQGLLIGFLLTGMPFDILAGAAEKLIKVPLEYVF